MSRTRGGARISGVGGYRPRRLVSNEEIAEEADVAADWIESRSGILSRHRAAPEETIPMMAAAAASAALADAGVAPGEVDLVVLASTTASRPVPGASPEVAYLLGCQHAGAFDINGACAGITYGLSIAAEMIRGGNAGHVVVVGADRFVDWTTPAVTDTYAILGDGAGALVVSRAGQDGIGPCVWGSDGSKRSLIEVPPGAAEVRMRGPLVYRWATDTLPDVGRRACKAAGIAPENLDWLVMHQANRRMIDTVAESLGVPSARVARDVVHTGNTSSASIPLALTTLRAQGQARGGQSALLIGFGAGLTYAAQAVRLD